MTLRFELQSWLTQQWHWAEYDTFNVGNESTNYTLTVGGYTGNTSSDAMSIHSGVEFTTKDRDNDPWSSVNCAQSSGGGFWYKACAYCNINAVVGPGYDFGWYYLSSNTDWKLTTSRMWLVCPLTET